MWIKNNSNSLRRDISPFPIVTTEINFKRRVTYVSFIFAWHICQKNYRKCLKLLRLFVPLSVLQFVFQTQMMVFGLLGVVTFLLVAIFGLGMVLYDVRKDIKSTSGARTTGTAHKPKWLDLDNSLKHFVRQSCGFINTYMLFGAKNVLPRETLREHGWLPHHLISASVRDGQQYNCVVTYVCYYSVSKMWNKVLLVLTVHQTPTFISGIVLVNVRMYISLLVNSLLVITITNQICINKGKLVSCLMMQLI